MVCKTRFFGGICRHRWCEITTLPPSDSLFFCGMNAVWPSSGMRNHPLVRSTTVAPKPWNEHVVAFFGLCCHRTCIGALHDKDGVKAPVKYVQFSFILPRNRAFPTLLRQTFFSSMFKGLSKKQVGPCVVEGHTPYWLAWLTHPSLRLFLVSTFSFPVHSVTSMKRMRRSSTHAVQCRERPGRGLDSEGGKVHQRERGGRQSCRLLEKSRPAGARSCHRQRQPENCQDEGRLHELKSWSHFHVVCVQEVIRLSGWSGPAF